MKTKFHFLLLSFMFIMLNSCYKNHSELWEQEKIQIRNYLSTQGVSEYTEDPHAGYFYYKLHASDETKDQVDITESVEVNARATLLNGTEVYSTYTDGLTDTVQMRDALYGWQLAMQNFYVGDKIVLILPSRLAYGAKGIENLIPPNSVLIFEIELVQIHPHF